MTQATPSADFDPAQILDPSRALEPVTIRVNEQRVRRGFLPKVTRLAARLPFATELVSVYFCARDPLTPTGAKAMMMAAQ